MNTKRIMRWIVVLFLLAALPVITAALAQGEHPAELAPVVKEQGESQAINAWDIFESEPNNTQASADVGEVGHVIAGKIDSVGDVDYYRIDDSSYSSYFLLDVEAQSIGSPLDAEICMVDENNWEGTKCNNDSDGSDPLLFYGGQDDHYFIRVFAHNNNTGGNNFSYRLIVSSPLLVSAAAGGLGKGNVAGITFQSGDVLAHSDLAHQGEKWVMFFDASDVGVKTLSNLAVGTVNFDRFYFSVPGSQTLPGYGPVSPYDVVEFNISSIGPATTGTFSWEFSGRDQSLTTSSEKIDALEADVRCPGTYYNDLAISTTGVAKGDEWTNITMDDEDILALASGEVNYYFWSRFFDFDGLHDGPDARMVKGMAGEDVFALSFDDSDDCRLLLTILGSGKVLGHTVNQKDIFAINYSTGSWGGVVWHGPDHGWNYNIDAFEYDGH